jgi:hypothetical protein
MFALSVATTGGPLFDFGRNLLVDAVSSGPADNCIEQDYPDSRIVIEAGFRELKYFVLLRNLTRFLNTIL